MAVAGELTYKTNLDTSGYQKGINGIQNTTKKAGSTIKNIVVGLGITKLISASMNTIKNSIDGAVARVDTLNNFPKVMSNLGISSEKAEKSIKKMSDKLAGLPTTLDQGASAVQRFTSANNDVEKSTEIFLALNNAIIAGGAPTEQQASAMEQLSQAYAKGKPDMMEWRTAMSAMPAQLKQVAEAMGYVNADELGEALRKGEVSMDEFMDTIVKLNTEGINGLENFEKQARNATDGIATAITVAKTQVTKGVADIIKALNVKLKSLGINGLGELISKAGKKAKIALDEIAKLIQGDTSLKKFTDSALELITKFLEKISESMPIVVQKAFEIISVFVQSLTEHLPEIIQVGMQIIANLITGISQQLPMLIPQAVTMVVTIVKALIDNVDLIIDAGIDLILGLAQGLIEALPQLIEKVPVIIDNLLTAITDNLPKIIDMGIELIVKLVVGLIEALPKLQLMGPKIIVSLVEALIKSLPQLALVGPKLILQLIEGIVSSLPKLAQTAKEIVNTVINGIKNLPKKMIQWGKDCIQGFIDGFKSKLVSLKDTVLKVAGIITKPLHFSRPDEGPLREYETWMPDMVKGLAESMAKSSVIIEKQSKELAQKIKDELDIDYLDDVYDKFKTNVMIQTGEMSFSGTAGSINEILTANNIATIPIENKLYLDGDVVYENQKQVTARKNLQTQFGGAYNVSN